MKQKLMILLVLLPLLLLTACGTSKEESKNPKEPNEQNTAGGKEEAVEFPQLTKEVQGDEKVVEMETSMGKIVMKLFPTYAPKAVENFIKHSEDGYYNGVIFHRVMNDFMIQGGDPEGTGMGGESIYGGPFEDEFSPKLFNIRGALSMANAGPGTNGSQFFIVQNTMLQSDLKAQMQEAKFPEEIIKAYDENGGTPWLDGKHTVFGQVIEGMDIVDSIAAVEVDESDKPLEDVVIKSITVK